MPRAIGRFVDVGRAEGAPPGPTSTYSSLTAAPVAGSASIGGHSTRPARVRTPRILRSRSAVKKRESTGPTERR